MKDKIKFIIDIRPIVDENNCYHYFYLIRNKINGKEYYGIHSTKNLNDGYSGSGRALINAIKKYGINSFYKQAIKFFQTRLECSEYERSVVNLEYLTQNKNKTYNLVGGGENGHFISDIVKQKISQSEKGKTVSDETRQKIRNSKKNSIPWNKGLCGENNPQRGKKRSEQTKRNISDALNAYYKNHCGSFTGRHHSDKTRKKQSISKLGKKFTDDHKKNLSKSHIGLTHTNEAKKKISEDSKNNPRGWSKPKKILCTQLNMTFQSIKDAWKFLKDEYKFPNYIFFCKKIRMNDTINGLKFEYLKEIEK